MIRSIISALLIGVAALVPAGVGATSPIRLADDAPDSHVVVPGDTLWGISGKFLKEPWRWPEVWRLNREEIHNPHLIYPGQVVVLDRSGATPSLKIGKRIGAGGSDRALYEKRFPQVYSEPAKSAIQSIPVRAIQPFLSEPLVVNDQQDADAGIIVATQEGRVFTGAGDTIFATRVLPGIYDWNVYRKAKPLKDPVTGEVLGFEAAYLGQARVSSGAGVLVPDAAGGATDSAREGAPIPASLIVTSFKQEIGKGDRLLPAGRPELPSYVPHAPEQEVSGRVVSIYNGVGGAGRHNVVAISVGKRDQIEVGHVLALHRNRGETVYREDNVGPAQRYKLPEQRYGLVFVFRVFERLAYALVMESDGPATVADSVRKP